jgi:16S rRNA processing protein RimM
VTVAGRRAAIVRRAGTEQRPIVRLEGVEDRAAADALRGTALTVEQLQAPALAEGEWWGHELEGCEVVDGERRIGTVTRMIELPSCEALEVRREMIGSHPPGEPLLVPMVKDAIRRMAVDQRQIEIDMAFLGEAGPGETSEGGREAGEGGRRAGESVPKRSEGGLEIGKPVPKAGKGGEQ